LVAIATLGVGGVALAQGFGVTPSEAPPSTFRGPGAPLRIQVTLTDGQTVELNCARVLIDFPTGGRLKVTENGALPAVPGQMTANGSGTGGEGPQNVFPGEKVPSTPGTPSEGVEPYPLGSSAGEFTRRGKTRSHIQGIA
jgi:hypothetical protein